MKWKNYGLWVSLFSLLGMLLIDSNIINDIARYDEYVKLILSILVAAGIISNPNIGNFYLDKEDK